MKTSLFRTCSNKVTLVFQKQFENTRKKGGRGPLGPSPKSAYVLFLFSTAFGEVTFNLSDTAISINVVIIYGSVSGVDPGIFLEGFAPIRNDVIDG